MSFRKYAIKRCFIFSSHLSSASALAGKTGNMEITSFHLNVKRLFFIETGVKVNGTSYNLNKCYLLSNTSQTTIPYFSRTAHQCFVNITVQLLQQINFISPKLFCQ